MLQTLNTGRDYYWYRPDDCPTWRTDADDHSKLMTPAPSLRQTWTIGPSGSCKAPGFTNPPAGHRQRGTRKPGPGHERSVNGDFRCCLQPRLPRQKAHRHPFSDVATEGVRIEIDGKPATNQVPAGEDLTVQTSEEIGAFPRRYPGEFGPDPGIRVTPMGRL